MHRQIGAGAQKQLGWSRTFSALHLQRLTARMSWYVAGQNITQEKDMDVQRTSDDRFEGLSGYLGL